MNTRRLIILSLAGVLCGCGTGTTEENYGMSTLADIQLTQINHPHGYQQISCFNCHVMSNIHQVDRVGSGNLPVVRALVQDGGLTTCSGCHGTNGVTP